MKTTEILRNWESKDLFFFLKQRKEPCPGIEDSDEKDLLWQVLHSDYPSPEFYLERLEVDMPSEKEFLKEMHGDKKAVNTIIEHEKQMRRIGLLIQELFKRKEEYVDAVADYTLRPDVICRFMLELSDKMVSFLRDAGREEISLDVAGSERDGYAVLEEKGYAAIRRVPAMESEDEREHFTGITLSEEFLDAFREMDTEKLEIQRKQNRLIKRATIIADAYYDVAPIDVVYRVYGVLCDNEDSMGIKLPPDAFEDEMKKIDAFFTIVSYRGRMYYCNGMEDVEINDSTTGEDSYYVAMIEDAEYYSFDYFIPSYAEMTEFLGNGYWPSRKHFRELRDLIQDYYLDEKTMREMEVSMRNMFSAITGMEKSKCDYSMDDVERETDDTFFEIISNLLMGVKSGEIYKENKRITAVVKEPVKRRFRRLLKCCEQEANQCGCFGYTRKEFAALHPEDE